MNCAVDSYRLRRLLILVLIIAVSCLAVACGGGGGGGGGGGDDDDDDITTLQGFFLDSPVEGLDYDTPTHSGTTDRYGTFTYEHGEMVHFSIGNLDIGSALGQSYLSPVDLVAGASDHTDPTIINICKLLQVLDEDGDLSNGIDITDEIKAIVSDM